MSGVGFERGCRTEDERPSAGKTLPRLLPRIAMIAVGRNGCPDRAWRCRPDVELTPMVGLLGGFWMLPGNLKGCRSATRLVDPCCWIWVNTVLPDGVGEVARTRTLVGGPPMSGFLIPWNRTPDLLAVAGVGHTPLYPDRSRLLGC
ncbi:hypothetical protein ACLOJK_041433 [Asimina triloba]